MGSRLTVCMCNLPEKGKKKEKKKTKTFLWPVFLLSMKRLLWIMMPNVVNQFVYLFRSTFQGKLLKHNLDSEVVDALKDLRKKLSENESKTQSS